MNIGIVGSGSMGSGIALAFAKKQDINVILCDTTLEYAEKGKSRIVEKLQSQVKKNKLESSIVDDISNRIIASEIEKLDSCYIVIEAIPEKMNLKKELFLKLQNICSEDTIFASNTSSLSVTEMAQGIGRTVVGMHFFNPADVLNLVEVVAGAHTSQDILSKVIALTYMIDKTPIRVKESPGFVVNRILIPMINEAIGIYAEGVASAEDIDIAMKLGANHPMGPLALGDLIGLDVCLDIMDVLQKETGDDKYRAHTSLRKMVRAGYLGRKTGNGFYSYTK